MPITSITFSIYSSLAKQTSAQLQQVPPSSIPFPLPVRSQELHTDFFVYNSFFYKSVFSRIAVLGAMGYSSVGKTRLKVFGLLCVINTVVLALSSRVNQFLDFFFMADLFPFILSIITLVSLSVVLLLDFAMYNPFTSRPPFEIGFLTILSILWLASNAFSTSRWRFVPLSCGSIPDDFSAERTWCRDLQALKAFVWIEWVILLLTTVLTIRYAVVQHVRGNKEIWRTALSHYVPRAEGGMHRRNTSFFSGFGNNDFSISDAHIERTY